MLALPPGRPTCPSYLGAGPVRGIRGGGRGGPVDELVTNKVLNRWYRDLAKEAGVRRITSHGARHTAGSSYAVMGAGQKIIGTLLGHSDSASTERYTHIAPSATTAMVEARWLRLCGGEGGR